MKNNLICLLINILLVHHGVSRPKNFSQDTPVKLSESTEYYSDKIVFVENKKPFYRNVSEVLEERKIIDLETIYSSHGVPIEFWYNETTNNAEDRLGSVPGCPQSIDGVPWIYYGDPPRCYLAGVSGPCPVDERIVPEWGSVFGVCACECLVEDENIALPLQGPGRYLSCTRRPTHILDEQYEQIYDRQAQKCYKAFQQGPCQEGARIARWTKDSIQCLQICDTEKSDWKKLHEQGSCEEIPASLEYHAGFLGVMRNEFCPKGKQYSKILQKCIKTYKKVVPIG